MAALSPSGALSVATIALRLAPAHSPAGLGRRRFDKDMLQGRASRDYIKSETLSMMLSILPAVTCSRLGSTAAFAKAEEPQAPAFYHWIGRNSVRQWHVLSALGGYEGASAGPACGMTLASAGRRDM
jgi:hypothetical protein